MRQDLRKATESVVKTTERLDAQIATMTKYMTAITIAVISLCVLTSILVIQAII